MTKTSNKLVEIFTFFVVVILMFICMFWALGVYYQFKPDENQIKIEKITVPEYKIKEISKPLKPQSENFLEIKANFDFVDCDKIREGNDMVCLACNIYHEARDQSREGQLAVANVTLNRVESDKFPDNICDVVWQDKQFSWTWDGKSDKTYEEVAWKHALELSYILIKGTVYKQQIDDNTNGALWYHADYTTPYWMDRDHITAIHGDHIFYKSILE